ncbi:oxidoreductase [Desulfosporosinus sp. SYSU MS00001]|uniref:oxidoreductase n=1 Tax=Desulfosporosinus sp. SYSU MS00001 TaxID=3416284 RepID=UPI003CEEAAA8
MTKQIPMGSGFGAASSTMDVIAGINLHGKNAIVTGGYSGLGLETVRALSAAGATVIVPTRDFERAKNVLEGISNVEIEPMDLLVPKSIDAFADKFLATGRPLHIQVNSAGIMACPLTRDARGYEAQFATNHLGHFQLTAKLWPALCKANSARVIAVSSLGHRYSPVVFEDPNFEKRDYDRFAAYGQSKTANILFAVELDKRGKQNNVRAFSLHPGSIVGTGLEKYLTQNELITNGILDENGEPIRDPSKQLKTISQGAATTVWCATNPELNSMGGLYCENCDIAPLMQEINGTTSMGDATRLTGVRPYAIDPVSAEKLWSLSEKLIGLAPWPLGE